MEIKWIGSPNRDKGREGYRPEAIVIHIMEGTLKGTDAWFLNEESGVSAHYGIGKDGEVHQYVGESDGAWHAGRIVGSTWPLLKLDVNPNYYTIGIEHEGREDSVWPDTMYETSAQLVGDLCLRWHIPCDRRHIIQHREIRADKTCPGRTVDLNKLIRLANSKLLDDHRFNLVKNAGSVKTRIALNVRKRSPTTAAQIVRTAQAGEVLIYQGWTSNGLAVNGNAHWYKDLQGNYFWAGATEQSVPGLT